MAKKSKKTSGGAGALPDFTVGQFYGLNTAIKNTDELLPGYSVNSLNWLTAAGQQGGKYYGDHIELRRGSAILGTTVVNSDGFVSGLGMGILPNGTQTPFFSSGRKLKYYNLATNDTVEIGTDFLPLSAASDDFAIVPYSSISGSWIHLSSPNSSWYKINVANPANVIDFSSFTYRGYISFYQGRSFLWNRKSLTGGQDPTGIYLSYIDGALPTVSPPFYFVGYASVGTGDGNTKTFPFTFAPPTATENIFLVAVVADITSVAISGITEATQAYITTATAHGLATGDQVVISGVVGMTQINNQIAQVISVYDTTHFYVSIDSSGYTAYSSGGAVGKAEVFADDQNGNMVSNFGGTGTVNYITGAVSVTFNTAPASGAVILSSHYYENSQSKGVVDFSYTGTGRTTGEGDWFRQDDGGGNMECPLPISNVFYCFHNRKTWQLQIPSDDATATNLIYRDNVGIPNWRAAYATGEGIVYIDTTNLSMPKVRVLTLDYSVSATNLAVVPRPISDAIDLLPYSFTYATIYEWGDYYLMACQGQKNAVADPANDITFIFNKKTGSWDKTDYRARNFANYYGALLAGDSVTPNVFILFSGLDDQGFNIENNWDSPPYLLGAEGMKSFNRFVVRGLIQPSQSVDVYFSYDNGSFVKTLTIGGTSQYVNQGQPHMVGGNTIGSQIIGGGDVNAFPFNAEMVIGSDKFSRVAVRFKATGIGYIEIDEYTFKDVRYKSRRIIPNVN